MTVFKYVVSKRVDPPLFLAIGVAAYFMHERRSITDPTRRLGALLGKKMDVWLDKR